MPPNYSYLPILQPELFSRQMLLWSRPLAWFSKLTGPHGLSPLTVRIAEAALGRRRRERLPARRCPGRQRQLVGWGGSFFATTNIKGSVDSFLAYELRGLLEP
jgi:hypothetical protein